MNMPSTANGSEKKRGPSTVNAIRKVEQVAALLVKDFAGRLREMSDAGLSQTNMMSELLEKGEISEETCGTTGV